MEKGERRTVVLISPHLDDAVFSVGGVMAALVDEGHTLHLVTCFTRSVPNPTGFALACQLDKGLSAEVDYMQLRREEDRVAGERLGVEPHWLDLPEAPHRGYESASTLFGNIGEQDTVQGELMERLAHLLNRLNPDLVMSPIGIGNHVDHQQVKQAVGGLLLHRSPTPSLYWYDEPYLARHPALHPKHVVTVPPSWTALQWATESASVVMSLDIEAYISRKVAACAAYTTQLGFQFGGAERIKTSLVKEEQRFTELVVAQKTNE